MMSGFRRSFDVLRESTGSYVNGSYVGGTRSTLSIMASIQPVVMGQDLEALPEGRRASDAVKVYSATSLYQADTGYQPDIIVYNGYGYEIVSEYANQSGVINHYKYIAIKVIKVTSLDNWINGTLARA